MLISIPIRLQDDQRLEDVLHQLDQGAATRLSDVIHQAEEKRAEGHPPTLLLGPLCTPADKIINGEVSNTRGGNPIKKCQ